MAAPERPWKRAAHTLVWRGKDKFGRSLRTERYRYTEWGDGKDGVELYDHNVDPHEWTNLARSPKTADVREELKRLI